MKRIIETMKELGVEVPEEKREEITAALSAKYKAIEEHNKALGKIEAERDDYKTRYEAADAALKGFEGIDPEKLNEEILKYKQDAEELEKKYKNQIAAMEYESAIEKYFSDPVNEVEFTSEYAKKAFLQEVKEMGFKVCDGAVLGLTDYVKQVKERDKGVFVDKELKELEDNRAKFTTPISPAGKPPKMTLTQAMEYANTHPGVDPSTLI